MNYWPSENTGLAECAEPLFQMLLDASEKGREAAEKLYGLPGWCMHHNSDEWLYCLPSSGRPQWSFWPFGGVWLCRHIADHYFYTGDRAFLKKYYPVLTGAAKFVLAFLVEKDGVLTTSPSTSPENDFIDPSSGKPASVAHGAQMDLSLTRELFLNVLKLAPDSGMQDNDLLARIGDVLPKLKKPEIGKYGELLEYGEPLEEIRVRFAHLSHLYGAFPGSEFTENGDPAVYNAAIRALERRGLTGVGWCIVWRAALWARFGSAENFALILKHYTNPVEPSVNYTENMNGVFANLFNAHPPFQFDGNTGIAAAIAEAFMQSHLRTWDGAVVINFFKILLPEWQEGKFSGLRGQGGITADLEWKNGRGTVRIEASLPGEFLFRIGKEEKRVSLAAGGKTVVEGAVSGIDTGRNDICDTIRNQWIGGQNSGLSKTKKQE